MKFTFSYCPWPSLLPRIWKVGKRQKIDNIVDWCKASWWDETIVVLGTPTGIEPKLDFLMIINEISQQSCASHYVVLWLSVLCTHVYWLLACCKVSGVHIVCAQLQYLELKLYFVSIRRTVSSVLDWPLLIWLTTWILYYYSALKQSTNS